MGRHHKDKKSKRTTRPSSSSSSESIDSEEELRRKDIKERDEFSKRLKEKDDVKTRKIIESSDKRAYEEAAKRMKIETEDRDKMVPTLRIQSRRKYLEKRKDDKVAELEADIVDDEYLFDEQMFVLSFYINVIIIC